MANANSQPAEALPGGTTETVRETGAPLEDELCRADRDFERGDYIELTDDDLERCIATGESPWPNESRA
jgi:hypothetical protein